MARRVLGGAGLPPLARLVVLAGVAYQTVLAASWFPAPQQLFNGLYAADRWQPSLFPPAVMLSLPKLGSHAEVGYPPNTVGTLALGALLAAGFLCRSKLRLLPLAVVAALGLLLLPVDDSLERSRTLPRRYEAEHLPFYCAVRASAGASNGQVCRQNVDGRSPWRAPSSRSTPAPTWSWRPWWEWREPRRHGGGRLRADSARPGARETFRISVGPRR